MRASDFFAVYVRYFAKNLLEALPRLPISQTEKENVLKRLNKYLIKYKVQPLQPHDQHQHPETVLQKEELKGITTENATATSPWTAAATTSLAPH